MRMPIHPRHGEMKPSQSRIEDLDLDFELQGTCAD